MITGIVQTTRTNDYGYTSYKISSTWYGGDSKGPARASEGEKVTFEAFDKPGQGGKVYPTIKLATFKKVSASTNSNATTSASVSSGSSQAGSAGTRDSYWADKEAKDAVREPRITYQASYERALLFVDLAIRNGAFESLAKAKPPARLEILQAFVDEQAGRIMKNVYAAEVPKLSEYKGSATPDAENPTQEVETEETWS